MAESVKLAAACSGMVCFFIGITHTFCYSKRTCVERILCWAVCIFGAVLMRRLLWPVLGSWSAEVAAIWFVGPCIYLFDIPLQKRLFLFFFSASFTYAIALAAKDTLLLVYMAAVFVPVAGKLKQPVLQWMEDTGEHFTWITVFAGTGYLLMVFFFHTMVYQKETERGEFLIAVLVVLLLICGYLLAFFYLASVRESRQIEQKLRQSEQYYREIAAYQQKIRRMQHDMCHHFRVLQSCLKNGEEERMYKYLEELIDSIPEQKKYGLCANYTAGILLGYYAEKARGAGIRFQCDAQIPSALPVCDSHLSVVLGNALQNALEGCGRKAGEDVPFIEFFARVQGEFLVLKIKNSFDGMVAYDEQGRMKSVKQEKGHGIGLDSVEDIVRQYHGYYRAKPEGNIFVLSIVLGLAGDRENAEHQLSFFE